MENLGWRLLTLWRGEIIREALEDMEKAGKQSHRYEDDERWEVMREKERMVQEGRSCKGIDGIQPTPVDTPMVENFRSVNGITGGMQTRTLTFGNEEEEEFVEVLEEFPNYVDPMVRNGSWF